MKHAIYTVGGTVQAGGGFYISRQADDKLLNLCRQSSFAYILTARQMGKSSLMAQTANRLAKEKIRSAMIDLTQIGARVTPDEWYLGLLYAIWDQLALDIDVAAWWRERASLGCAQRMTDFFRKILLRKIAEPVVIFVDEIGVTLSLDFTDDFFAAIRYLYNARGSTPEFKRLSFTLTGVATPGDLIRDPQQTPFDIGHRIELDDFTFEEAAPLAEGLNLPPGEAKQALRWAMKWTNGHPYLTQRLCRAMADARRLRWIESDVDRLVADTFLGVMSEQDNNLHFVRDMLTKRAPDVEGALKTYREILAGNPTPDEEQSPIKSHLKLSGVVRREKAGLRARNPIYAALFDERWIKEQLRSILVKRVKRASVKVAPYAAAAAILILTPYAWHNVWNSNAEAAHAERRIREAEAGSQSLKIALAQAEEKAAELDEKARIADRQLIAALSARSLAEEAEAIAKKSANQTLARATEAEERLTAANEAIELARGLQGKLNSFTASPAGKFIVAVNDGAALKVWDRTRPEKAPAEFQGHTRPVTSLAFSPDENLLVTASEDNTARIWNLNDPLKKPVVMDNHSKPLTSVAFSPNGKWVVTAGADGRALVWVAESGKVVAELREGDLPRINSAAFSPDGKYVVTASEDGAARIWDVETAKSVATLRVHNLGAQSAIFTSDGKSVLTAGADHTVRLWDLCKGEVKLRPVCEPAYGRNTKGQRIEGKR
jgi:hypothetical protein